MYKKEKVEKLHKQPLIWLINAFGNIVVVVLFGRETRDRYNRKAMKWVRSGLIEIWHQDRSVETQVAEPTGRPLRISLNMVADSIHSSLKENLECGR
jgi:hypothetical protein